jgi:DNA-binding beta-propeller fold protein YncE
MRHFKLRPYVTNVVGLTISLAGTAALGVAEAPPLERVQVIPLKGPIGRLDHLALDSVHHRLFIANMANASLDVVDLEAGKLVKQIPEQKGIQGVAYAPDLDRIFVGNGAANACNVFDGRDYRLLKTVSLEDADNVRYDAAKLRIFVSHRGKGLAVIDAKSLILIAGIKLPAEPEGFQLELGGARIFLNTPSSRQVVVIDREKREVGARYTLTEAGSNFPLALDEAGRRLFVGCRKKPSVFVLDMDSGKELASVAIPGDTDDLFFDGKRKRIYASCGEGFLAVIDRKGADKYELLQKISTVKLARTSLYDPARGRLYLVVPRRADREGPEVWVYRANP